jgi:hypothetical protein
MHLVGYLYEDVFSRVYKARCFLVLRVVSSFKEHCVLQHRQTASRPPGTLRLLKDCRGKSSIQQEENEPNSYKNPSGTVLNMYRRTCKFLEHGSLPHSQEPISTYFATNKTSPQPHILFTEDSFHYHPTNEGLARELFLPITFLY